jgi:hypothetical protein
MNWSIGKISLRGRTEIVFIIGTISAFLIPSVMPFAIGDSVNPGVFSIDAKPYGVTYAEWTARWWQWVTSLPKEDNPNYDYTGEKCAKGQEGPVWFLGPTFGGSAERTCTMPAGKSILFPILTSSCDYITYPNIKTESDLLECAMKGNEEGVMEASVDGVKLKDLQNYRIQSGLFNITIPENNVFGGPSGISEAMVDGFFVFLEPLTPGRHEIHFAGSVVDNPTTGVQSYSTDVTYHLIVKP